MEVTYLRAEAKGEEEEDLRRGLFLKPHTVTDQRVMQRMQV